jgi:tetratricopeptide (TPR) repeat protein
MASTVGWVSSVLLVALGLWGLSVPLRADAAAKRSLIELRTGDAAAAARAAERATSLMPQVSLYAFMVGEARANNQNLQGAAAAFDRAATINPRDFSAVITAARAAERLDDRDRAEGWYERAAALEPHAAQLREEIESFRGTVGHGSTG